MAADGPFSSMRRSVYQTESDAVRAAIDRIGGILLGLELCIEGIR
jgi:hypothetical protein